MTTYIILYLDNSLYGAFKALSIALTHMYSYSTVIEIIIIDKIIQCGSLSQPFTYRHTKKRSTCV